MGKPNTNEAKIIEPVGGKNMEENLQQSDVSIVSVETAPAKKLFPKNKLIAIISIAIVVLCIAAAIIINANRPINRFDHALKAGEYDVAAAIYKQNNSDEKFLERSAKRVGAILSSSLKEYDYFLLGTL